MERLRDLGNTVIVVEHDREMIESADYVVDFVPGGGNNGGIIVAQGSIEDIKKNKQSFEGKYLNRRATNSNRQRARSRRKQRKSGHLIIRGARQFSLKISTWISL